MENVADKKAFDEFSHRQKHYNVVVVGQPHWMRSFLQWNQSHCVFGHLTGSVGNRNILRLENANENRERFVPNLRRTR